MRLELGPFPEFWTVVANHRAERAAAGKDPDRTRRDRLRRNVEIAEQVQLELGDVDPNGDPDVIFQHALSHFIGDELSDFRVERFPAEKKTIKPERAWDRGAFDDMLKHFRGPELDDLEKADDHRPGRVLLLVATEYTLVPLLEGAFAAMQWGPASARYDFRSAFHTVTRWAVEVDQRSGRLVTPALTVNGVVRPWSTLTRFYAAVLGLHRPQDAAADALAERLSVVTLEALHHGFKDGEPKGAVMRRLMTEAESLGVIEEMPARAIDSAAQARTVLAELVLQGELGIAEPPFDLAGAIRVLNAEA